MNSIVRNWEPQADYGTPQAADPADDPVQVIINGREISTEAGNSIMRAALAAGIQIPKQPNSAACFNSDSGMSLSSR